MKFLICDYAMGLKMSQLNFTGRNSVFDSIRLTFLGKFFMAFCIVYSQITAQIQSKSLLKHDWFVPATCPWETASYQFHWQLCDCHWDCCWSRTGWGTSSICPIGYYALLVSVENGIGVHKAVSKIPRFSSLFRHHRLSFSSSQPRKYCQKA